MNNTSADDGFTMTIQRAPIALWLALLGQLVLAGVFGVLAVQLAGKSIVTALICLGFAMLLGLQLRRLWRGRHVVLILTQDGLMTSDQALRIELAAIGEVKTGLFDVKPASGLGLSLCAPMGRYWQPGLIWVKGTRVGIGGMIPKSVSKLIAQTLAAQIESSK